MKKIIVILTGAPGSGKGYLGDCLIRALRTRNTVSENEVETISTGDLIRREVQAQSELGLKIKEITETGGFVSDEIIASLIKEKLLGSPARIIIFDGYPRTQGQVRNLTEIIGNSKVCLIHRDTPPEMILRRVRNRRICENCGKVQTADHADCISCHGKLIVRRDDAVIDKRLQLYGKETLPALQLLQLLYPSCSYIVNGSDDAEISVDYLLDGPLKSLFRK